MRNDRTAKTRVPGSVCLRAETCGSAWRRACGTDAVKAKRRPTCEKSVGKEEEREEAKKDRRVTQITERKRRKWRECHGDQEDVVLR